LGGDRLTPERGETVPAPSLDGSAAAFPPVGVNESDLEGFIVDEKRNRADDLLVMEGNL
jgi:hypothetical protein